MKVAIVPLEIYDDDRESVSSVVMSGWRIDACSGGTFAFVKEVAKRIAVKRQGEWNLI